MKSLKNNISKFRTKNKKSSMVNICMFTVRLYEFHVGNCVLRILIGLERKNSKYTSGSITVSQENSVYCVVKIKIFV